ncbi:hypothetical protein JKP88DRAFT_202707 [Tribonema minus]|uniref:Uncharacterized protein n=1 Tax=Tribonema minus TaxID=303371 RepID=A0A836C8W9_9STRA|nr:hypothetical protein JKP88DRAFT_202707 [Tribonema minus]
MPTISILNGEEVEYVEVYDEPIHKCQFSNEYAYCYIATINPGESCMWHRHSQDSFYVALASCEAINRPTDKPEGELNLKAGDKWWSLYKAKDMVHQVCLPGTCAAPAKFFGVEVLKSPPVYSESPLGGNAYTLLDQFTIDRARIYDMTLQPGQSTGMHTWNFFATVLCLSDGELSTEGADSPFAFLGLRTYGQYKWVEGPVTFSVKNEGSAAYTAVVVEWVRH